MMRARTGFPARTHSADAAGAAYFKPERTNASTT